MFVPPSFLICTKLLLTRGLYKVHNCTKFYRSISIRTSIEDRTFLAREREHSVIVQNGRRPLKPPVSISNSLFLWQLRHWWTRRPPPVTRPHQSRFLHHSWTRIIRYHSSPSVIGLSRWYSPTCQFRTERFLLGIQFFTHSSSSEKEFLPAIYKNYILYF